MTRLVAALLLLSGCAVLPSPQQVFESTHRLPIAFRFHEGVPDCLRGSFKRAASSWFAALRKQGYRGEEPFAILDEPYTYWDLAPRSGVIMVGPLEPEFEARAVTSPLGVVIMVRGRCTPWDDRTAAHELGHVGGLRHSSLPHSVMYRFVNNPVWSILDADAVNLLRARHSS